MILADVMDEIGAVLADIPGLNAHQWPPDAPTPPAAWPTYPDRMGALASFQRGTKRWQGGLMVAVGRVYDRAARNNLSKFTAEDGPQSIEAALVAHDWQACAYARPVEWTVDAITIGGVDMLAAFLELDIAGPGLQEG